MMDRFARWLNTEYATYTVIAALSVWGLVCLWMANVLAPTGGMML